MKKSGQLKACMSFVVMMLSLALTLGAAHAVTINVTNPYDPGDGTCDDQCTLREAITRANATSGADTINATGIGGAIDLASALPNITESVTITGPGAASLTVRRNSGGEYRIFNVNTTSPHTVNISGLTISNGNGGVDGGGGIFNYFYTTLNLDNCTLSGNSGFYGGGIENAGTLNVTNCTFSGNSGVFGGAIDTHGGTLNLTNSTLSGNSAGTAGGGIYNDRGTVTITGSTLSGNSATRPAGGTITGGGGIYSNVGTLTVTGSTFNNNTCTDDGGGIFSSGTMNITNSTLHGNSANIGGGTDNGGRATFNNCTVSGNSTSGTNGYGGGLHNAYNGGTVTTLRGTIVALNTAPNGPDIYGVTSSPTTGVATGGFNLIGINNTYLINFPAGNPNANNDIVGTPAAPIDPGLDPSGLQDNGGPTKTIALLPGSPALDKGKNFSGTSQDQRGVTRPNDFSGIANANGGDGSDIGAFEMETPQGGPAYVVNNNSDHNGSCTAIDCSLREAINAANGDGVSSTITFAGTVRGNIGLDSALPGIVNNGSLTISGPGARLLAVVAASFQSIDDFAVNSGATATISGLTIANANYAIWNHGTVNVNNCAITTSYRGVLNEPGATVNLTNCTLYSSDHGLSNFGTANATNCTLSSNYYGIFNNAGTVTATHCTITANGGVGIYNGGPATIKNTICAGNPTNLFNVPVTQQGNNLTSGDPLLGPLAYNGGPTQTHALLPGSPAIDGCNSSVNTDQRGFPRPVDQPSVPNAAGGNGGDIGAFELPVYAVSGRVKVPGGAGLANVRITRTGSAAVVFSDSDGNFSFSGLSNGAYTLTPSLNGYAFTPATRTATVNNANVTGQNFTAYNWTLSGRVFFGNGNGLANVEMRLNTGRSILTNGAGYYTFAAMIPGSYTITPVLSGYSFDPALRQVSLTNGSISGQNFTGGYSISGRLSNSTGGGITGLKVYRSGSGVPAISNSAGYYFFYGLVPGNYTVTPDTTTGYGFTPQSRSVTIVGSNISGQNFAGTTGYRVMGRIATSSGAGIANVSVSRGGAASPVVTNSAGYFTFYGVPNGNYTLTPTRAGMSFTPATRSITVNGADVPGQNFTGQ